MTTVTGGNTGAAAIPAASGCAQGLQVLEGCDARGGPRGESGREVAAVRSIIEISDKDYRSFCFPCHALEDVPDCNAGY
jgi:hypothetical protein